MPEEQHRRGVEEPPDGEKLPRVISDLRNAEKKQVPGTVPIGVPLLGGLKDAFPCTKE
jgi:hypothetical protein